MKKYTFISAVIFILILLCAPVSHGALCDEEPGAGLICHCCLDGGEKCPMISCTCCRGQIDPEVSRMTSEMVIRMPDVKIFVQSAVYTVPTILLPDPVYLEVPVLPPISS